MIDKWSIGVFFLSIDAGFSVQLDAARELGVPPIYFQCASANCTASLTQPAHSQSSVKHLKNHNGKRKKSTKAVQLLADLKQKIRA